MKSENPPSAGRSSESQTEMADAIGEVLRMVRNVASGDLSKYIPARYPATHPVGALAIGVNAMVEALAQARATTEAHQRELRDRIAVIGSQDLAIRELSTPIIEVWDSVLCLPIVGLLDSGRAAEMTRSLLSAVVAHKARFVIIDITGIQVMDTQATDHFIRMARSVRLLGSRCVLAGVSPHIALTVASMGVELQGLKSHRTMRDALNFCARAEGQVRDSSARGMSEKYPDARSR